MEFDGKELVQHGTSDSFGKFKAVTTVTGDKMKCVSKSRKQDVCLSNTDVPGSNKVQIRPKSVSPIFLPRPPRPQGHVMSVNCEEPID